MAETLDKTLQQQFGFGSFREGQRAAIESVLSGRNTAVVMATGAGKSLIYQLAAVRQSGLTLVISPLIALMKDQVDSLKNFDIPAAYINSSQSSDEKLQHLDNLTNGQYKILLVAPERLRQYDFIETLTKLKVDLLVID